MLNQHYPIIDLHCDLLYYLALNPLRTHLDLNSRCSLPQMREGNVISQIMAIFTTTNANSTKSFQMQMNAFINLYQKYSNEFTLGHKYVEGKISIIPAIENASGFCEENDHLDHSLKFLTQCLTIIGSFAYISLTWNSENRFGGGAHTDIGLKPDGMRLLDYMFEHQIPIDLSHTSDKLAYDILNYIDQKKIIIPILASHSNARSVTHVIRNLPDELIKEMIRRQGIIGINFVRDFLGSDSINSFNDQLEYFHKIGAQKNLCFGADFFCLEDVESFLSTPKMSRFFPGFENASCYQKVLDLWFSHKNLCNEFILDICYRNASCFFNRASFFQFPPLSP